MRRSHGVRGIIVLSDEELTLDAQVAVKLDEAVEQQPVSFALAEQQPAFALAGQLPEWFALAEQQPVWFALAA